MPSLLRSARAAAPHPAGATYASLVLADSPLVYLRMREALTGTPPGNTGPSSLADSSGNGYNAGRLTSSGTLALHADTGPLAEGGTALGGSNMAAFFAASNPAISDHANLTVEFWLRYDTANTKACPVYLGGTNTGQHIAPQWWTDGNIYWDCGSSGGGGRTSMPMPSGKIGVWTMWDFVADATNSQLRIYMNGVQQQSASWTPGNTSLNDGISPLVWPFNSDYDNAFAGAMGELAVYLSVIPATNMVARYNKAISG